MSNNNDKPTAEMLRDLLKTMKLNITDMMRIFGIGQVNFSTKQLEIIEDMIDKQYPVGHKPMATTLIPFAYYLGECIIRSVPGAHWHVPDDADSLNMLTVSLKSTDTNHLVYPFTRAAKFWHDRTDRMSTMVRMTQFMAEIQHTRSYLSKRIGKDGWIQSYYGDCYRIMIGDHATKKPIPGMSYMKAMKDIEDSESKENEEQG